MSITAKQVEQTLASQGIRKHVNVIEDNDGEVVIWVKGLGHPVTTVEAAVRIANQAHLETQCALWGI